MFKRFSLSSDVSGQTPVKSSIQRSIRNAVLSQWKIESSTLEVLWPKKETLTHVKCKDHLSIYAVQGEPIFFQHSDGPIYPTLRVLHRYPFILPAVKVDRGAIRFLLAGASMMCPGLTSAGGYLPPDDTPLAAGVPVAIFTEGKEHAAAIGITKLSTIEMRKVNKGVGVEPITYLGDEFWAIKTV